MIPGAEEQLAATRQAFDGVAAHYDGPLGNNAAVQHLRRQLWAAVERHCPPGSRLLDLGCGTGLDAAHFARLGYRVTAIDPSPRMAQRTAERAEADGLQDRIQVRTLGAHELDRLGEACFDAVYSDLGALNCCPEPGAVAAGCAAHLPAGGVLILSVIGRYCPWELLYYARHGQWRRATLRLRRGAVPVPLEGQTVWTRYYSPAELYRSFARDFVLVECRALGLFLPPPYLLARHERLPAHWEAAGRLDALLGGLPVLRQAGDHFLLILRRR